VLRILDSNRDVNQAASKRNEYAATATRSGPPRLTDVVTPGTLERAIPTSAAISIKQASRIGEWQRPRIWQTYHVITSSCHLFYLIYNC
jgi:hypothetical protein